MRRDLDAFLAEERAEIQRMDDMRDLIALEEERLEHDPDDIEATNRFLERFWRE